MSEDSVKLYDLIDAQDQQAILTEILHILSMLAVDDSRRQRFISVYKDIVLLFNGDYPGYRASNTRYHNLEHTTMVALGTARLIHGCTGKMDFAPDSILTGLLAALYHDVGLIQTTADRSGTGAKYTIGHENRSVTFMRHNMGRKFFPAWQMDDCEAMIQCTNIHTSPSRIAFRNDEIHYMGMIVGSADLLSQIADRKYLEKLTLLFKEFEEAGIPGFHSEAELVEKTEDFYDNIARSRLINTLGNVSANMQYHFRSRWQIDRDLYAEAIENNIGYLRPIVARGDCCKNTDYQKYLRRGNIA